MSNRDILEKAIQKALDNGWIGNYYHALTIADTFPEGEMTKQVIFNHDFAKALWGESWPMPRTKHEIERYQWSDTKLAPWQGHLQQMVISEDPIKYLGDNI